MRAFSSFDPNRIGDRCFSKRFQKSLLQSGCRGALVVPKALRGSSSVHRSLCPSGFTENHSHEFYIMFFVLLAVSTERKHARELSSVLLSSRHPPCTHPPENIALPPPLSHLHLLLSPWGIIFISTVFPRFLAPFLVWVSHKPRPVLPGLRLAISNLTEQETCRLHLAANTLPRTFLKRWKFTVPTSTLANRGFSCESYDTFQIFI